MDRPLRVLMVTTGWPTPGQPQTTHFIKRQVEFLRAAGVHVDVFRFRALGRPWNYPLPWLRLRRQLWRGGYDLIHAQWGGSGMLAFPKRLPLVVTYRGSDVHGVVDRRGRQTLGGRVRQAVCRFVARHADAVILVSAHMRKFLDPTCPVHVIPSGLDLELFRPGDRSEARRRLGLPPAARLVLFAGDPASARKRYSLAREAVDLLSRSMPAELVVAWDVPHTSMPDYMNACDAMVFTSRQEGSPNVVKEALACDLPVVSVEVGDVAVRLAGVEGCELCPDERPETIAAALARVLERGTRARSHAHIRDLDETRCTAQVIDIYRAAVARWAGRAAAPSVSALPGARTSP